MSAPAPATRAEVLSAAAPVALRPLLIELNDLKRVRSAGRDGSIATRLFREAWGRLLAGEPAQHVMLHVTATALSAARLGDLDRATLRLVGLSEAEASETLVRAFDVVAQHIATPLRDSLRVTLSRPLNDSPAAPPQFVAALEAQPRAGVTCPGSPRIVLEPPESHAEHCLMVAVYGALLAPAYGADPATAFLAGLSHHFHNVDMPDSGFTGEMLLAEHLTPVIYRCTRRILDELDPPLRAQVERARLVLADTGTPEGEAFHAADVIDRVLQIAQHLRAASLTMDVVLGDMHLVHDGPVKPFHDRVLMEMALP